MLLRRSLALSVFVFVALVPCASSLAEPIVLSGDVAPGAGGGVFVLVGQPDINEIGEVSFFGTIAGGTAAQGVFVGDGVSTRAVALIGTPGPGSVGLFTSFLLASVQIDDDGDAGFFATLVGGVAPSGLFLEDGASITAIALVGDLAPETAGTYAGFGQVSLNNEGQMAFVAAVSALPPVAGVFVESASSGEQVVEIGDSVPGVGGASFESFGNPVINDDGEVAFRAEIAGPGIQSSGVFHYSSAGVGTLIALEGASAPGTGGATFEPFDTTQPSIDSTGNVYFEADVVGGTVDHGLFVGDGATPAVIAIPGDSIPLASGATIDSLLSAPDASPSGGVAFIADLTGSTIGEGVFLDLANGSARVPVALEGESAAGTGGGTFNSFSGRAVPNDSGDVTFLAGVAGPNPGLGIFVPEPATATGLVMGATMLVALVVRRRRHSPNHFHHHAHHHSAI